MARLLSGVRPETAVDLERKAMARGARVAGDAPERVETVDMSPFDGPDELTWYAGLPRTLEQAYGKWREKRSALTDVTEEV